MRISSLEDGSIGVKFVDIDGKVSVKNIYLLDDKLHVVQDSGGMKELSGDEIEALFSSIDTWSNLPTKFQFYEGIGVGTDQEPFSATRVQGLGTLFKKTHMETGVYGYLDLDTNITTPLKTKGFGQLFLTKEVYKGANIEGRYTFTGQGNNIAEFGLSYGGGNEKEGYKVIVYPLNNSGKQFTVNVSGYKSIKKNDTVSAFIDANLLGKSYYAEAEYAHDFSKNLAAFVQLRTGGFFKDPFVSGVVGGRVNIK